MTGRQATSNSSYADPPRSIKGHAKTWPFEGAHAGDRADEAVAEPMQDKAEACQQVHQWP